MCNKNKVGCLLVTKKDDGVILDEIYLEEEYRNKGIGTEIIKNILKNNFIVYLWVYKKNIKVISLYKKEKNQLNPIKLFPYLDDYMNIDSTPGEYLIEIQDNKQPNRYYEVTKNEKSPLKYYLNYIPKDNLLKNKIFLNFLTGLFLVFNLRLLYTFKKEILRKKDLIFPIILLCLKILLTNSEVFSNISIYYFM